MRLTFPGYQIRTIRTVKIHGDRTLKLVARKLNQAPIYFVVWDGVVIHAGKRKHCVDRFNAYVPHSKVKDIQYLTA